MLLAGFLPGLFSAFIYGGLGVSLALIFKDFGPPVGGFTLMQKLESLPGVFPIFFVIAIIILFIYNPTGGDAWGTPTEGGALGAFVVFVMAVTRGNWAEWGEAFGRYKERTKETLTREKFEELKNIDYKSRATELASGLKNRASDMTADLKSRAAELKNVDFKERAAELRQMDVREKVSEIRGRLPRLTFFEADPGGDPEVRGMRWPELKSALLETARLSVMIFTIIWGVLIYVRFLGFADLPGAFADWISSLEQSPMLTLILILLAYAVLGMFMDAIGMLLLTLPVVYPAVIALNGGEGVSVADSAFGMTDVGCAIWFGIIVVKMAELCLITPPIGLNCFVVAGVQPEITVQDVFRGSSPFFIADALTIAGLIAFPGIVLYLPGLLLGF